MPERCVCCGEIIPEGRQVCPICERNGMPLHPCVGCVYYKVCGNTNRTEPCYGRMTKREKKNGN